MGKVLHASKSGYFPYCIQESADSRYAIFSLQDLMKIYWRVRTWTFSASGTRLNANDQEVPFSTSLGNIQSGFEGDEGLVAHTTEEQLVCGSGFFLNQEEDFTYARIGITNPVKKVGDLYGGVDGRVGDNEENVEYVFRAIPVTTQVEVSSTISIFGGTFFIGAFSTGEVVSEPLLSLNLATLTPTLWWSYGGTYNPSTGARL
jgi:hypothetical protein